MTDLTETGIKTETRTLRLVAASIFYGVSNKVAVAVLLPALGLLFWEIAIAAGWFSGRLMPPPYRVAGRYRCS